VGVGGSDVSGKPGTPTSGNKANRLRAGETERGKEWVDNRALLRCGGGKYAKEEPLSLPFAHLRNLLRGGV